MSEAAVLNWVLFLPLVGVALLAVVPVADGKLVRAVSLAVMVAQLALTAWLYSRFDASVGGLQFETRVPWIAAWGVSYQIGLDGYNILLVLMTAYLGPLVVAGGVTPIARGGEVVFSVVF